MFWKGMCWSIATITRKITWKLNFYGRHLVLERTIKITKWVPLRAMKTFIRKEMGLPLTDPWIGSEKGILHFTFTVIVYPATGTGDLKFTTDSLPLFWLNQTSLIGKSDAPMMWGGAMPYEMYEFIQSFSSTSVKNTQGFEIKFSISVAGVCVSHNCKRQLVSV